MTEIDRLQKQIDVLCKRVLEVEQAVERLTKAIKRIKLEFV